MILNFFLNLFIKNLNRTFYLKTTLNSHGEDIAIKHYQNNNGNKIINKNNKTYTVLLPDWKTFRTKYPDSTMYTNRFIAFTDVLQMVLNNFTPYDNKNIFINEPYCLLLDPTQDHLQQKRSCVYTICVYNIKDKTFEIADIVYEKTFLLKNQNIIPINPLLDNIDFTKEIHGRNPFIYFPEINAISLKISHSTHRDTPKHLQHIQQRNRIWIKN